MKPEYFFLKKYGLILLCTAGGAAAGPGGAAAGFTAGFFITLIINRIGNEREWSKAVEQGVTSGVRGEPFPGALYICALIVNCLGNSGESARFVKNTFGTKYHADWHSLCRAASGAGNLNSDLLVECLAHIMRKNENIYSPAMMQHVFTLLGAAEFLWDEKQDTERPSHYLAELLDYKYVRNELSSAYDVLGLPAGAAIEQVKTVHRKLAAKYHPDNCAAGTDAFMRVQAAYEFILHQQ
jgi:hypothetical protein